MRKKVILWTTGGAVLAAALLIGILSAVNGYFVLAPSVQLILNGEAAIEVNAHGDYIDEGVVARKGKDDLSAQVTMDDPVDLTKPGTYIITYSLTVKEKTYTQRRTVTVVDREAPVLELLGEAELKLSARKFYEEPGFTVTDRCDGDLTEKVTVTEVMEGDLLTLTYTVADAAGNEATAQRLITIRDEEPPVLKLKGYGTVYVARGKTYKERGYTATDDVDGDIASAVVVSGSVDTSTAGTYTLTYKVSDQGGNEAEATRKVKVYKAATGGSDRVYLTFDDGPSSNVTPQVLDILAANDVQATFFILNYSSSNKHLVKRMINEGHTVAIHGYSHDYAAIYANDDAFMENIYRLRDEEGLPLLTACIKGVNQVSGALVASIFDLRMKNAIPAIFLGVVAAGLIMTFLSYGVDMLI